MREHGYDLIADYDSVQGGGEILAGLQRLYQKIAVKLPDVWPENFATPPALVFVGNPSHGVWISC